MAFNSAFKGLNSPRHHTSNVIDDMVPVSDRTK